MILKLKEVLWEITPHCSKGCRYCGSKNITSLDHPTEDAIYDIAKQIASYGVESVTITGGEPGSLPREILQNAINILANGGCEVKIVTNGDASGLSHVSLFGVSINYPSDYNSQKSMFELYNHDYIMISNIGIHNIWHFKELSDIASKFKGWQIQLTMVEHQLPPDGISYLKDMIRNLKPEVKYVLADNLQDSHNCSAGINCCSILYNGDVIPCLSARSCKQVLAVEGNVHNDSLQSIWETGFRSIRFGEGYTESCRNCISYPEIKVLTPTVQKMISKKDNTITVSDIISEDDMSRIMRDAADAMKKDKENKYNRFDIQLYGCQDPNVFSYGVTSYQAYCDSVTSHKNLVYK